MPAKLRTREPQFVFTSNSGRCKYEFWCILRDVPWNIHFNILSVSHFRVDHRNDPPGLSTAFWTILIIRLTSIPNWCLSETRFGLIPACNGPRIRVGVGAGVGTGVGLGLDNPPGLIPGWIGTWAVGVGSRSNVFGFSLWPVKAF